MADNPTGPTGDGLEALFEIARGIGLTPKVERFYFLRHGQTEGNATRRFQHPEIPLNTIGHTQAQKAGEILAAAPISQIFASTMARAWLTAGWVAAATRKSVIAEPLIRERYFGDLIGTPSVGFDWRNDPPGGETLAFFVDRTLKGVAAATSNGGVPLLVAHGGNLHVIRGALGLDLPLEWQENAFPLLISRSRGRWAAEPVAG